MMKFLELCPNADIKPHDSSTGKSKIMVFGKERADEVNEIKANIKGLPKVLWESWIYKVIEALNYKYLEHIFDNQ
jgi:hypothetical protein